MPFLADAWGIGAWLARVPEKRPAKEGDHRGKWLLHGYFVDGLAEDLARAARIPPERRVNWTALGEWLRDEVATDTEMEAAIKRRAARTGYDPAAIHSIAFFDQMVREAASRSRAHDYG